MKDKSDIAELLQQGESQTTEFKTSFGRESVETLAAFANTDGGTLLVGVANDGNIIGVPCAEETVQTWVNTIKSNTTPSIIPNAKVVTIDGKTIVSLQIDEFPVKPVASRDRYFRRVANSNHRLSLTEIANLHLQSLQLSGIHIRTIALPSNHWTKSRSIPSSRGSTREGDLLLTGIVTAFLRNWVTSGMVFRHTLPSCCLD